MKTKKRTEIIFETHEVTRIRVARKVTVAIFDTPMGNQNDLLLIEKTTGFKMRLKEKLREFWKLSHRRRKSKIQESDVLLPKTREDK